MVYQYYTIIYCVLTTLLGRSLVAQFADILVLVFTEKNSRIFIVSSRTPW